MLLSCNVILLGAFGALKIPRWGGSATGVVSVLPPRVCQKGRFSAFVVLLFLFQRLNFRHAKRSEKVFGLQRMNLAGGEVSCGGRGCGLGVWHPCICTVTIPGLSTVPDYPDSRDALAFVYYGVAGSIPRCWGSRLLAGRSSWAGAASFPPWLCLTAWWDGVRARHPPGSSLALSSGGGSLAPKSAGSGFCRSSRSWGGVAGVSRVE